MSKGTQFTIPMWMVQNRFSPPVYGFPRTRPDQGIIVYKP